MDTNKCKILLKVLEFNNLTKASQTLGYTVSGISKMISSFEKSIDLKLFIRDKEGLRPTKECLELLPLIKNIALYGDLFDNKVNDIKGLKTGEVKIGISCHNYFQWFSKIIYGFKELYPHIKVNILHENSTTLINALLNREIDLCLISERQGDFEWIHLLDNPMVIWLPSSNHYVDYKSYPIKALEHEDYIRTFPDDDTDSSRLLKANNISPSAKYTTTDSYATYCMVEAGLGVALDNGIIADNWSGKVIIKPIDPPYIISLGIAYNSKDYQSPALQAFLNYLRQIKPEISK
jgi:DNA-binding transcriptional LysR family regulator